MEQKKKARPDQTWYAAFNGMIYMQGRIKAEVLAWLRSLWDDGRSRDRVSGVEGEQIFLWAPPGVWVESKNRQDDMIRIGRRASLERHGFADAFARWDAQDTHEPNCNLLEVHKLALFEGQRAISAQRRDVPLETFLDHQRKQIAEVKKLYQPRGKYEGGPHHGRQVGYIIPVPPKLQKKYPTRESLGSLREHGINTSGRWYPHEIWLIQQCMQDDGVTDVMTEFRLAIRDRCRQKGILPLAGSIESTLRELEEIEAL